MRMVSTNGKISVELTFGMFAQFLAAGESWVEAAMNDLREDINPTVDLDSEGRLVIKGWFSDIESHVSVNLDQHISERYELSSAYAGESFDHEENEAQAVQVVTQIEYLARTLRSMLESRLAATRAEDNGVKP